MFATAGAQTSVTPEFKNDLEGALAEARARNKLVLVNFTGYSCTNCHWMKANMFHAAPRSKRLSRIW